MSWKHNAMSFGNGAVVGAGAALLGDVAGSSAAVFGAADAMSFGAGSAYGAAAAGAGAAYLGVPADKTEQRWFLAGTASSAACAFVLAAPALQPATAPVVQETTSQAIEQKTSAAPQSLQSRIDALGLPLQLG